MEELNHLHHGQVLIIIWLVLYKQRIQRITIQRWNCINFYYWYT